MDHDLPKALSSSSSFHFAGSRDDVEKRIREAQGRPDFVEMVVNAAARQNRVLVALRDSNASLQSQVAQLRGQVACTAQFPQFAQLPPELRRKIWTHALPAPRVVAIDYVPRSGAPPCFVANHGPPVLLAVSREARAVARAHYEPAFQAGAGASPIYFDFQRDTLCFAAETTPVRLVFFLEDMPQADIARVRFLAVGTELPRELCKYITQFHGLEVFSLIMSDPRVPMTGTGAGAGSTFDFATVAERRSIWFIGSYWNHSLTSWSAMELNLRAAFEDERDQCPECKVPVVEFVYVVSVREGCCIDCPGHSIGGK